MSITRETHTRQYEHIGNVRHGVQTGPWRIELPAPVKDEAASKGIYQGSVVSLNSDGQYVIGCAAGSGINHPVPFISMKNIFDPDVTTGYQGRTQADTTYSAVGGMITAIPCTSGYELETTEFVAASTYAYNDGVIPATSTDIGKITVATAAPGAKDPYLGFVSKPPTPDYFDNKRVAFLTSFIPAGMGGIPDYSGTTSAVELTATNGELSWA